MKRILPILIISMILSGCDGLAQQPQESTVSNTVDRMLPAPQPGDQLVVHHSYTLSYSEPHEQARWVAYMLCRNRTKGDVPRTDFFDADPAVTTGSATYDDYRNSGYTRGHLMPAADVKWDKTAMEESFLMSNISPQLREFNDGVWNRLEGKMRHWANVYDTLYIVTGPVLDSTCTATIGRANCVTVPQYFYKAVYCPATRQCIGFLVKHEASNANLKSFAVSIDELEQVTGIDFFAELDDTLENEIEATACTSCWKW